MITAREVGEVRAVVRNARAGGKRIAFVPTMGFLHEGHLSLIDTARRNGADFIVVSIFVNPTQFGPGEDFDRYPRDEARDSAMLVSREVDLLFAPEPVTIYPPGFDTWVEPGSVAAPLEGQRRPGHFRGVSTVVLKLFNIVQPDIAVFGRKDAQQCAVISSMVRDLEVPVQLVFGETVREDDGVAMSSRNAYLSEAERKLAPALRDALRSGAEQIGSGSRSVSDIEAAMSAQLATHDGVELDYLRLVDAETFQPPVDFSRELLLVGAVKVGRTRLIDNVRIALCGV